MNNMHVRRGVLKELLGKRKSEEGTSIFLGIDDPMLGPVIATCWENHWPIWHVKHLLGYELDYLSTENGMGIVLKFDQQRNTLRFKLMEILINKGKNSMGKFRIYDEQLLELENNIYVKEFIKRRNLELLFNHEQCNENNERLE